MGIQKSKFLSIIVVVVGFGLPIFFQNCSKVGFQESLSSKISTESLENCTDPICDDLELGLASCMFNGQEIFSGQTVTAYLNSSGDNCVSEQRLCTNGTLSGSYQYSSCTIDLPNSCLFNGQTIPHNGSVTAFQNSSAPCESESRICNDGVLSGSFQFTTCVPDLPDDCTFNGNTVKSGSVVTAFQNSTVPFGSVCEKEFRLCTDGTLNGSFNYPSCSVDAPASCSFNGQTIPHLGRVNAYLSSSVPFGSDCKNQDRICNNGVLSGSYSFPTCSPNAPLSCSFNGQTIAHGQKVGAYQSSTVPFGSSCNKQDRVCDNGSLSGTFAHPSCNVDEPATCLFNGTSIASGQSVIAFHSSSVPFGESCKQQSRTCFNGSLSGSYTFASCTPGAPRSCMFGSQTIAHGAKVRAYPKSSVPFGGTCDFEDRTCNDGTLSGSAAFASCSPSQPKSCLFNGITVVHGDKIKGFKGNSVPYGALCVSEDRVCNNGSLSGTAPYLSCEPRDPANCEKPGGGTVIHGKTVTLFTSASVPYGSTCKSQVRSCHNGELSGTATHPSCSPLAPKTCSFNGATIAHNGIVKAFTTSTVPYGSTCVAQDRKCSNGVLSGTAAYASCKPKAAANCSKPGGGIVAHGSSVTLFTTASVPYGSKCGTQSRKCNNGVLSGTATNLSCKVTPAANCAKPGGGIVAHGSSVTLFTTASVPYGSKCGTQVRSCNNGSLSGTATNLTCAPKAPASCTKPWGGTLAHGATVKAYSASSVPYGSSCASQNRTCSNGKLSGSYTASTCTVREPDRKWVNAIYMETHSATCARVNMLPSENVGYGICASGEARPKLGYGVSAISYVHGKWGSGDEETGGVSMTLRPPYKTGSLKQGTQKTHPAQRYCWRSGQKKDNDRTDRVVAYLCKVKGL